MSGQMFVLNKDSQIIGRDPRNDIPTDQSDLTVSGRHAEFVRQNGQWFVKNVSKHNKMFVNQSLLEPDQQQPVRDHDRLQFGTNNTFLFLLSATRVSPPPSYTETARGPEPGKTMDTQGGTPTIEVTTNLNSRKQTYRIPAGKQVINIGRMPAPDNDIIIDEPVISGFHVQIKREQGQLVLIHPHPLRQSTANGLIYKGKHIHGDESFQRVLSNEDVFLIGNEYGTEVKLTYHDGTGAVRQPVPDIPPIQLGAPVITIGRGAHNTVVLSHPQVSVNHARLERSGNSYTIIDQNSTNHVYVNNQPVSRCQLKPQDVIRIGPFDLVFTGMQLIQHSSAKSIRIDAVHIIQRGDKQKILLNDISLTIPAGKFVAIVGGSGAGKTTLMDALNGTRPAKTGRVYFNGQDYYASRASFSTQLGYVPQFDIIHKNLTVERALYYAAKLRLPSDTKEEQIKKRVDEVMEAVGISMRRKLLISKLSGGQQKRVSIALELLAKPNVFFLDEPTSGLDPGLDRKMMKLLHDIAAREGNTIILVTHATNNINNCDYVCFLAPGGYLTYFGPPADALAYFNQADFAEIYSSLEPTETEPDIPAKAEMRFKSSREYQQFVEQPRRQLPPPQQGVVSVSKPQRGDPLKQFLLLSMRYLEIQKNDGINLAVLLLQAPIVAILVVFLIKVILNRPTVFSDSTLSIDAEQVLFVMSFVAVFFGCNNSAREIVKEVQIYRRERMVNLGIMPYLFSKIVILGVLCLLQCAILVIVVNATSAFQQGVVLPPALEIYVSLSLTSLAGLMIGLMISSLTANSDQANAIIPLIIIAQIIFSGVIFKLPSSANVIGAFFATRWSMIAMGSSLGLTAIPMGYAPNDSSFPYAHDAGHVIGSWFALLLMIVVVGALSAYFLKRKDKLGR